MRYDPYMPSTDALALLAADDDDYHALIRDLLICDDLLTLHDFEPETRRDDDAYHPTTRAIFELIRSLDRESLSRLRLDYSLCPLHAIDYAICFDDDDAECSAIRACFPNHDT